MKPELRYDREADAAYLRFANGKISESAEVSPGIVLDYDEHGQIVGMEVLNARGKLPATALEEAA